MPKFRVYLSAFASLAVEVEAEDGNDAVDEALNGQLPYVGAFDGYDLTPWAARSENLPGEDPSNDYEEID